MLGIHESLPVLCEPLNGKPYVVILFHLFRCRHNTGFHTRDRGLLYFKLVIHDFGSLSELQSFENWLFLITPFSSEAHAAICDIGDRV